MIYLIALLTVFYAILHFKLLAGLSVFYTNAQQNTPQLPQKDPFPPSGESLPSVSVLVCAKDEALRIPDLLQSLQKQDYAGKWELLVADDRSQDNTAQIVEQFAQTIPAPVRVIRIQNCPAGMSPKKNALTTLHAHTQNEIIITTDADCIVRPKWISTLVNTFLHPPTSAISSQEQAPVAMVLGHSAFLPFTTKTTPAKAVLWGVQSLDFLSHAIVAAAGVGMGLPITSNANSMAYRKQDFEDVNGYAQVEHIVSGDDDLLLHKFVTTHKRVTYVNHPDSHVFTHPQPTWGAVWNQRVRWASKTTHYSTPAVLLLSGVYAYYCSILIGLMAVLWGPAHVFMAGLVAWGCKIVCDYRVMKVGAAVFNKSHLLQWYIPTALLHVPAIVFIVIHGQIGLFNWKDQSMKKTLPHG
jgi:cellulose synthase/poly-beta-1,6-N-acetylglucosamine synthase-like glycosyltransferase